jgi:imidazolonepropionase-like amidohydrolase
MKTLYCTLFLVIACSLLAVPVAAQDLVINNVRIIGNGPVVEQGTILIRGGRIVSAAAGAAAAPGVRAIDGRGLTAVPGYIDAHRHIAGGRNAEAWLKDEAPTRVREFLEAGYTTLMSGCAAEPVVALKKAIDSGQMKGPRIIPSAPLQVGGNATPESGRDAIRKNGCGRHSLHRRSTH